MPIASRALVILAFALALFASIHGRAQDGGGDSGNAVRAALTAALTDMQCVRPQVIGACGCGPLPCGVRVQRFVPVAFIETVRAPGDSLVLPLDLVAPGALRPLATMSSSLSTTDNTSEVHVWTLPDPLSALPPCLACGVSAAAVPQGITQAAPDICGAATAVAGALAGASNALSAAGLPSLVYASEVDALNWRTGCRDTAGGLTQLAQDGLQCQWGGGAPCLGRWGALRPRQMRDLGPAPLLYSAKTAVRAMSVARDQLGGFPYPVDTEGLLQQVYPVVSACFGVGQLPLPAEGDSPRPARTSTDGRYGWIYWRPAQCCIGRDAAAQCLGSLKSP